MTDYVLTLGFLAQPPAKEQDGITSVALSVDLSDADANQLDTRQGDTVTWNVADGGPEWSRGTTLQVILIGQQTGTVLLTQSAFGPGPDESFKPYEGSTPVPSGVTNVYELSGSTGTGSKSLKLSVIGSLPAAGQAYQYRVVLYSPVLPYQWWIDPEIDVCPP